LRLPALWTTCCDAYIGVLQRCRKFKDGYNYAIFRAIRKRNLYAFLYPRVKPFLKKVVFVISGLYPYRKKQAELDWFF
jgi:hypothetical protein